MLSVFSVQGSLFQMKKELAKNECSKKKKKELQKESKE